MSRRAEEQRHSCAIGRHPIPSPAVRRELEQAMDALSLRMHDDMLLMDDLRPLLPAEDVAALEDSAARLSDALVRVRSMLDPA